MGGMGCCLHGRSGRVALPRVKVRLLMADWREPARGAARSRVDRSIIAVVLMVVR